MNLSAPLSLISHDRCLMDNICTQILGLGRSIQPDFFADYSQFEKSARVSVRKEAEAKPVIKSAVTAPVAKSTKKLTYMEQKELEGMERQLGLLENRIEQLQQQLDEPFNQSDAQKSLELYHSLAEEQKKLDQLFVRWQELENKGL